MTQTAIVYPDGNIDLHQHKPEILDAHDPNFIPPQSNPFQSKSPSRNMHSPVHNRNDNGFYQGNQNQLPPDHENMPP